jgi:hypothetical protein
MKTRDVFLEADRLGTHVFDGYDLNVEGEESPSL